MSILIDTLVRVYGPQGNPTKIRVDNRMYIAKPCDFKSLSALVLRFKDAWRVLIGKSQAYHYYED